MRKDIFIFSLILVFAVSSVVLAKSYDGPVPERFNQAPEFEEMVADGELPPLEERLPDDPYVVEPNEKVGEYGGTALTNIIGIEGFGDDTMLMSAWSGFIKPSAMAKDFVPHLAKDYEVSEDKTTWTFYLREGIKWSDGEPFTVEDVMFWYEDVLLNEELTPVIGVAWRQGGEIVELNKIDDYTVEFSFAEPNPYFAGQFIHRFGGVSYPKHYLKQFHIDYADEEELKEMVEESDFDHWYQLFDDKAATVADVPIREELPTLAPYKLVEMSSNRRIFERNPYYWKVDTEGNQLPYIERIEGELVGSREVYQGKVMSGEADFAAYQTDIRDYPMYRNYEDEGGYNTILWESGQQNEVIYFLAMTHEEEKMREVFQDVNFRKALSLAIDRDELNEAIYFGKAEPMQYTVSEYSEHYQKRFTEAYVDYDPEKARELLDEMGMKDVDEDGWRETPDGEEFTFTIEFEDSETPKLPNVELVTQFWQDIGIDVNMKQISGELIWERGPANLLDATVWHGSAETDVLFPVENNFIIPIGTYAANINFMEWASWYLSDGESGEEPPEEIMQILEWYEETVSEPDAERREELAEKILNAQAENLWGIGTIGKAPYPVVINKNLRNFPEDGLWGWEAQWTANRDPEQFFFEGQED